MASESSTAKAGDAFVYPDAPRDDTTFTLHGREIADPYRPLEDPDAPATKAWVKAQNVITDEYLGRFADKGKIRARFDVTYDYEKLGSPFRRGHDDGAFYYFRNSGLQNQNVLYRAGGDPLAADFESMRDSERALLDLNAEFPGGTTALSTFSFSEDGKLLGYGLSKDGSDWSTLYVRDVETGENLPDKVPWTKFTGISWTHDGKGFFYCRYPAPPGVDIDAGDAEESKGGGDESKGEEGAGAKKAGTEVEANKGQQVCYHRLGTAASEDVVVFEWPEDKDWRFGTEVTDDGAFLLISVYNGCDPVNRLFYAPLTDVAEGQVHGKIVKLIDNFDAQYEYLANTGRLFYFKTNKDAPRYRIISTTLPEAGAAAEDDADALAAWPITEFVAQTDDVLSYAVAAAEDFLVLCYLHDVCDHVYLMRLSDAAAGRREVPLPAPGTIASLSARRRDHFCFFKFTNFLSPGTVFKLDFGANDADGQPGVLSRWYKTEVREFDEDLFETTQRFTTSKDGTRVPYFVVAKRGGGGPRPCILYGYGGFNISIQPSFSSLRLAWLQNLGGALVVANIRGGGEYGEEWHKAGSLRQKQNVFDDFAAVAETLVKDGVTTPAQLCIQGGSNGGLLVLACALQRPELYGAGISQVPVTDMLRFHKFTIGHAWCTDYGNADESKEDFEAQMAYSPLHNVKAPTDTPLPALLITTADHDDRVVPLHSFKMLATLQAVAGKAPVQASRPLIARIEVNAGHGAGKPTSKVLDEYADIYAFAALSTGATWSDAGADDGGKTKA
uniref:Prolyl endopeptidase n=1 Tax=Bicosoecida sp. CB-2014 TaxID=1486930 RepID=A0A7S1C904_9STRA